MKSLPLLSFLAIAPSLAYAATPLYHVTDLGNPADTNTQGVGINSRGQVITYSFLKDGPGYVWSPTAPNATTGSLTRLAADTGDPRDLGPAGINDRGQIVGRGDAQYYVWSPTTPNGNTFAVTTLPLPTGFDHSSMTAPLSINNRGQIAGHALAALGPQHAVLWSPASPNASTYAAYDLGGISPANESYGSSINSAGQIAGYASLISPDGNPSPRAAVWIPTTPNAATGSFQTLAPPPQNPLVDDSSAAAVNDAGQVAGQASVTIAGQSVTHAFLWNPDAYTTPIDLGGPPTSYSRAIGNDGTVVGYAFFTPEQHAFLWTPAAGMLDLNTLLDPSGTGWTLYAAAGINAAGQIAGTARNPAGVVTAVLLTPVPEPALLALIPALLVVRRTRRP